MPRLTPWLLLLAALGCSAQKQAEDPREILGDDLNVQGTDGRAPSAETPAPPDGEQAASEADCRRAAERLLEVALAAEIRETQDPEQRAKLEQERELAPQSEGGKKHIAEWTRTCLEQGHTRAEAQCIADIRDENDIGRCAGENP